MAIILAQIELEKLDADLLAEERHLSRQYSGALQSSHETSTTNNSFDDYFEDEDHVRVISQEEEERITELKMRQILRIEVLKQCPAQEL